MQVNAIQNSLGFTGNRYQNNKKNIEDSNIVNNDRSNNGVIDKGMKSLRNAAIAGIFLVPVASTPLLTSCDADAEAYAWSNSQATAKDSCGCHHVNGRDTLIVRDTITQIIENRDTVFIKKGFDSPVIDVLRDFFESNDIPLGDGRIPLSIQWVDEQNVPAYYKQLFDGRPSSYDELSYNVEKTPWNDEAGSFVIGVGDTYENIRYSLTRDGKLMMSRFVPRNPYKKPEARGEWVYSNSAVYDINKNKKLVERHKVTDNGSLEYVGTFKPGDKKGSSIFVTNPYDTDWRYTNVKVVTGDAPEIDE